MADWGFHADGQRGALDGDAAGWCFWWTDDTQKRFEELWGDDADVLADELADGYTFVWPWMIVDLLPARAPLTHERIAQLVSEEELVLRTNGTNPVSVLRTSTMWGAFQTVRQRRSWDPPRTQACGSCGQPYFAGDPPLWTYRQFGPSRYCTACCFDVRNGRRGEWTRDTVIGAVRELAAAAETVPLQAYNLQQLPLSAPVERRDRLMRALCAMPPLDVVKSAVGASDWLGVLQAAELVDVEWRPSRGTWCRATDGHRCRSLLEKSIDDWLTANGISHECEPSWPAHATLNPSGRHRADWRLASGAFVECAGMLEQASYREKILRKQQLARELGIPLYVVAPSDLLDLRKVFAAELPG